MTSSRRFRDVLIKTSIFDLVICLQDVFKTFSRHFFMKSSRRFYNVFDTSCRNIFKTSSRCLQEIFKTSSRRFKDLKTSSSCLANTSSRRLQNVFKTSCKNIFKTSSRRFEDAFKTSPRHLKDVFQRCLQNIFKTYHQVKLSLLTHLWDAFNKFLRRTAKTVMYGRICQGQTSARFMISVQNLQEW